MKRLVFEIKRFFKILEIGFASVIFMKIFDKYVCDKDCKNCPCGTYDECAASLVAAAFVKKLYEVKDYDRP